MWNRISGKSSDTRDDAPSQSSRRNDEEQRSKPTRSGSLVSFSWNKKSSSQGDDQPSKTSKKASSRGDDRDRGFNPSSTSYSSTSQSNYPGTASASVATASGNHNDEPYTPPGLVRNASLADQMPKSRSSRHEREGDEDRDSRSERRKYRDAVERKWSRSRDRGDQKREKKDKRDQKDKDRVKGSSRSSKYGEGDGVETSRGPGEFPDQVGAAGFSQFPGQYNADIPHPNGASAENTMSSHVQDQFPGQFPAQSSAPYRPPIATSEGGPGLAAEYYGDTGESVAEQPGNRANTPSLIIGAEPHLQPALAVAAPPPEPSASGGVGAAASFFSGDFDDEVATSNSHQTPSTYATAPVRPNGGHHSSSAPAVPTIGGAAVGTAAGYFMGSQTSSHTQRPDHAGSQGGVQSEHVSSSFQRPPSPTVESYHSNASRPPRPGQQPSQSSNISIYAAGAPGLAVAAYQQNHHHSSQDTSSRPHQPTMPMAQQHRHHGPLGAVVDFFKDPDGVAQFEEYSEIIGICRYCFAPGSSPRDAPRRHHYRGRRPNEGLGRVDKDSRYHSSENESRRKKDKTWLATGLAGYGVAKVGEGLFKQKNDFDDTYSVKTGRCSEEGRSHKSGRRSRSTDRIETGITGNGKVYKKDLPGDFFGGSKTTTHATRRRSRSRSRSRNQKSSLADAALSAAIGTSVAASSSRRQRSDSPKDTFIKSKHRSGEHSPERRRKSHKKKKRRSFFTLGSASSSSSAVDLAYGSDRHRSSKRSSTKNKDDKKAEAAVLGLGAAAAALALNDGRNGHKKRGVKELVGVKETRNTHSYDFRHDPRSEDEVWESAPDDEYGSADSALAYGGPRRKGSQESHSSESSGTNKWRWRWGSKKERKEPHRKRKSPDHSSLPTTAGVAGAGLAGAAMMSPGLYHGTPIESTSSLPLQQVFPIPTSDPTRFDVGRESTVTSVGRPAVVPIQHPQPITPVSAALYSNQAPYNHSYSAPTGPPIYSRPIYPTQPTAVDARFSRPEIGIPGGFAQDVPQAKDMYGDLQLRRRDSSPARFGADVVSNSMAPRRRVLTKDDSSAVRFDRTEEQEESDRRERRRKRKEDRERREAEEQEQIEKDRRSSKDKSSEKSDLESKLEESPKTSSSKSWAAPAAAGIVGATIGAAAVAERTKSEETREERRERRRREREREEAEEEEATKRRERRRRERERGRDADESMSKQSQRIPDEVSEDRGDVDRQGRSVEKNGRSVLQETANPKRDTSHENYGDFFRPLDLDQANDQVRATSANTDADVDFGQTPAIITVVPKGFRDPDAQPTFSPADTDDKIDTSRLSYPVPKLRLVEPTPPSSRGSTPIIRPRDTTDEDGEEPSRDPSPSKVACGDDQTREYTVISPVEERQEFHEPTAGDDSNPDSADVSRSSERGSTRDHKVAREISLETKPGQIPRSYGDDIGFAAILAASAEDAGFDPSIVTDDPKYRRRDSPPGSNDRSMPGGFDDNDETALSKRDKKKKDRASKRRNEIDDLNGRNDNAAVQDIISQMEGPESQVARKGSVDNFDDDWEGIKKSKPEKSKEGRKDSGSKHDLFGASGSGGTPQDLESREMYDSPIEDAPSVASSAPIDNNGDGFKKSRKKSKRDSIKFDDTASAVSSPPTISHDSKSKSKDKSKGGSVWDRVLGRSTESLAQENGTKDVTNQSITDDFEDPKKKSKKSKERRSTRDEFDDYETTSKTITTGDRERKRSSGGSTVQDSGRITQDLPVKDRESSSSNILEAGSVSQFSDNYDKPEQTDEQRSKSFLDMRPEPPPPPDTALKDEEPPHPSSTASLPVSPRSLPEDRTRHFTELQNSEPLASPTAVPFDFRFSRPRHSIRSARSMSQTPPSPAYPIADLPPRTRSRPRSTEFRSSDEFRPSVLVERHRSHQESAPEQVYPSLPESRTTSQTSSIRDPEEIEYDHRGNHEITEASYQPFRGEREPKINTGSSALESDLLDSQQAAPTASSFQHPPGHDLASPPASRGPSPKPVSEDSPQITSSTLKHMALGAVMGGSAALALHKATQDNLPLRRELPQEEEEQFQQGLDDMALDVGINRTNKENRDSSQDLDGRVDTELPRERLAQEGEKQSENGLGDMASNRDVPQVLEKAPVYQDNTTNVRKDVVVPEEDSTFREDFAPQKTKKGKKSERRESMPASHEEQTSNALAEAEPSSKAIEPNALSPEQVLQIQEQDAQDAVDSWSVPVSSYRKGKKYKKKGAVQQIPETSEPTSECIDAPRGNLESPVPIANQENGGLTREMSADQVVDLMTAAAKDTNKSEDELPQSASAMGGAPIESQLQRRQSKSKAKKGRKDRKVTLKDATPSSNSSLARDENFFDPSLEQGAEGTLQFPRILAASEEALKVLEKPGKAAATGRGYSPEFTPLPFDEDLDLLDDSSRDLNDVSFSHLNTSEVGSGSGEATEHPLVREVGEVLEPPVEESRELPSPPGEQYSDDVFAFPSEKKGKKGKRAKPGSPLITNLGFEAEKGVHLPEDLPDIVAQEQSSDVNESVNKPQEENKEAHDDWANFSSKIKVKKGKEAKRSVITDAWPTLDEQKMDSPLHIPATPGVAKEDQSRDIADEPVTSKPQETSNAIEDEWAGFSNKKKGKKSKKSKQNLEARLGTARDLDSTIPASSSTSQMAEGEQVRDPADTYTVETQPAEFKAAEDEWANLSTKKKGMKGKKAKQSFGADDGTGGESTTETPLPGAPPDAVGDKQVHDLADKAPVISSLEDFQYVQEDLDGFSSNKKAKKGNKQNSKALYLGSGSLEPEADTKSGSDELAASQATTSASQDVTAILGAEAIEASIGRETKEPLSTNLEDDRELHNPKSGQPLGSNEWSLPKEEALGPKARESDAQELELIDTYGDDADLPDQETFDSRANVSETKNIVVIDPSSIDDTGPPVLDSSLATQSTARGVQDIREGQHIPQAPSHDGEAPVAPYFAELPSAGRQLEEAELDLDLPKRKKGKKVNMGKVSPLDDRKVDKELPTNMPLEDAELDWDVPKKKNGKKSEKGKASSLEEPMVKDAAKLPIPPAEDEYSQSREAPTEATDDFPIKKSKKDKKAKKNGLSRAASDYEAVIEPHSEALEALQDVGLEGKNLEVKDESMQGVDLEGNDSEFQKQDLLNVDNEDKDFGFDKAALAPEKSTIVDLSNLRQSDTLKPLEVLRSEEQAREELPGIFEEFQSSESANDKKMAKKAEAFAREEEGTTSVSKNEPVPETRSLETDVHDEATQSSDKSAEELTETLQGHPKSKKDRKKAKKAQSFAWESEDVPPPGPRPAEEPYEQVDESQTEKPKDMGPKDPAATDDNGQPAFHEHHGPESSNSPPDTAQVESTSAPLFSEQAVTEPEEAQVRVENFEAIADPSVEGDSYPELSLRSKKDKQKGRKTSTFALHNNETQQEPPHVAEESLGRDAQDAPSIVPISEDRKNWSKQEKLTEEIGASDVVEPDDKPSGARGHEDNSSQDMLTTTRDSSERLIEADEEIFAPVKNGKNGKQFKKENPSALKTGQDKPLAREDAFSFSATDQTMSERHIQDKANDYEIVLNALVFKNNSASPAFETQDPSATPKSGELSKAIAEDELWEVPLKKGKKGKKQRNKALKAQESEAPLAAVSHRQSTETSRDTQLIADEEASTNNATDMPTLGPDDDLLDPQEQCEYDQKYARELERQNVTKSPRSSRVELSISPAEAETVDRHEQRKPDHDYANDSDRQAFKRKQSARVELRTFVPESETLDPQGKREKGQEFANELESGQLEALRSPTTDLPTPATESERFYPQDRSDNDQQYANEVEQYGDEASRVPTDNLPTPDAESEMLDPQEQRKYDEEYAKELNRQLSPPQGEFFDLPPGDSYASSVPQPDINSMIAMPFEERTPLARPPPLEDIIEESRSRSGSVYESPVDQDDEFSPFQSAKKSKRGKKGRKQQQPVIWEDETATPPVGSEADHVSDVPRSPGLPGSSETGASYQLNDLEEAIEERLSEEKNDVPPSTGFSGALVQSTRSQGEADDYFAIQPSRGAETDVGRDPVDEDFRRSLSTDMPPCTRDHFSETESQTHRDEAERNNQPPLPNIDERTSTFPTDYSNRPESTSIHIDEEADNNLNFAPVKKSKKDKKSKRRELERESNSVNKDQFVNQSRQSRSPTLEPFVEKSSSKEHSQSRREEDMSALDEESETGKANPRTTEGLAAAVGLGVGALAAEGLAGRDSTKGGKKGKKSKRASKWADLEDGSPSSESPLSRDNTFIESAEQRQHPEQQRAVRAWQDVEGAPSQSPISNTIYEATSEETNHMDVHQPSESSRYRDSGINVSDSPVISEQVPSHRAVRDSGYPDTESSPTLEMVPRYQEASIDKEYADSHGREAEPAASEFDQGQERRDRRRSLSRGPLNVSVEVGADYDVSVSRPRERRRRSRSYNSDDSADSGFDIQRRRRRQALAREAREPSPVSSTTKDRSSALFNSSPSAREEVIDRPDEYHASQHKDTIHQEPPWSFGRQVSSPPQSQSLPREADLTFPSESAPNTSTYDKLTGRHEEAPTSIFGGPIRHDEDIKSPSRSPPSNESRGRRRLGTISEDSQERLSLHQKDKRALSDVRLPEAGVKERRARSPPAAEDAESYISTENLISHQPWPAVDEEKQPVDPERSRSRQTNQPSSHQSNISRLPSIPPKHSEGEHRTASAGSMQSDNSIRAIIRTPDQVRSSSGQSFRSSGTPPLRRVDRSLSGDLRGASKLGEAKIRAKTSEAELKESDPAVNIPSSSTYDPVTDKGKRRADMADIYEGWGDVRGQSPMSPTRPPSMRKRQSMQLLDLETRLDQLVSENRLLQSQKSTAERSLQDQTRDHSQQRHAYEEALQDHKMYLAQKDSELDELRGVLEEWQSKVTHLEEVNEGLSSSRGMDDEHEQRYGRLEAEHAHLRERHAELNSGMEGLVQREVASHLEAKNSELQRLRDELDSAKQQVRSLQQQLLSSRESEDFVERDEDYFDSQCQALCQHVQQWVLRFSKFSDMKACYRASEIRDETKVDRMENAILDGTDIDVYLQDRVKRRDVFMAVVVTMIFDYIFTRYLFGMDREQRQKLKNLEKILQETGPVSAVCKWRATTLTLLMKREDFARQRATDTEAIIHEIYDTLATFLPPPFHLVAQIQDSLRKVIIAAADLSIEMRTQRADYQMLPPLQPDYDTNGDLAQKVYFNALTMNERSGATSSNQALQEQGAVVRMVLFPLVVKNEEDDEQIIVCPAQVLTADVGKGKKSVRVMSVQGSTQGGRSEASFAGSDVHMEGGMI